MKRKSVIIVSVLLALIFLFGIVCVVYAQLHSEEEGDIFTQTVGEFDLEGRDTMRKAGTLVLYTKEYPRNEYGYEVLVEKDTNTVIARDVILEVEEGTYILSGHGDAGRFLKKVDVGDHVKVQMNKVKVTRHLKFSNLKKIEIENEKANLLIAERQKNLMDIDMDAITAVNQELDGEIAGFNAYFDALEEGVPAETRVVNSKMRTISRLIDMKYYHTIENNIVDGRAMWHAPNGSAIAETDLDGVKTFAQRVYDMGINTVYVQTFTCGMTIYYSEYLQFQDPRMASYSYGEYGNDYLLALISECHKLGIEVHAWFNVLDAETSKRESPEEMNGKTPDYIKDEWITVDLNGSNEGHFLDPSNPEVLEFLKNVAYEILTEYDFDGISYDYIRYAESGEYEEYRDSGFTAHAIQAFSDAYNYRGRNLTRDVKNNPEIRAQWHEFKQNAINQLLKELAVFIRGIDKELVISASPFGYFDTAKSVYMQDVATWMGKGYIDVVLPMIYTDSVERFCDLAAEYDAYSKTTLQYSGLYVLYSKSTLRRNQEVIEAVKAQNISGTSFFASQNYITNRNEEWDFVYRVLSLTTHKGRAVLPTANPNEVFSAWKGQLLDRCNRIYFDKMTASDRAIVEQHVGDISVEMNNPADVCVVLDRLRLFEAAVGGFENKVAAERITSQIDYIYDILDAAISRQMIRYGYWDMETTPERPDPTTIQFAENFA